MLSIEYCDVEEEISAGDLFDQIGFSKNVEPSDSSGDTFVNNKWPVEVKSLVGFSLPEFFPIEGFRWTKPERQVKFTTISLSQQERTLQCSPEHIVYSKNAWVKVGDLSVGQTVRTEDGFAHITKIEELEELDRLCDLQVSTVHSYLVNGILSHNSHFLVKLGSNAIKNGTDVVHYTFELSETAIATRYDSHLCDIDSNEIFVNKDKVKTAYKDMKLGKLIIKFFPTGTCTVFMIRSHLERLAAKGIVPGLIIIDYADIMRSSRQFDSLRHELKLVYEELRGLAGEKKVGIWSASQSNKEGANSDVIDMTNMAESYGKAAIPDVILSISRKPFEKAQGTGRIYLAKNRAGRDGLIWPVKINTARSQFEICGETSSFEEEVRSDEQDLKKRLKQRWNEIKNDKILSKSSSTPEIVTDEKL